MNNTACSIYIYIYIHKAETITQRQMLKLRFHVCRKASKQQNQQQWEKSGKSLLVIVTMHVYIFYIHRYLKWDDRVLFSYNKVYRIIALITFSHVFIFLFLSFLLFPNQLNANEILNYCSFLWFADANVCISFPKFYFFFLFIQA